MRFKITFELIDKAQNLLPINYQYEISSWIYRTIHNADPVFSAWLHDKGYTAGKQRFKFFTFSNIEIPHGGYKVIGDRLRITADNCRLVISFLIEEAAAPFITGVFLNQNVVLGDKYSQVAFAVNRVERLSDPLFTNEMLFTTLSPIVIGKSRLAEGGKGTAYLWPDNADYEKLFFQNLSRKVEISRSGLVVTENELASCKLQFLSKSRMKGILIKAHTGQQSKVIGYTYKFKIIAPEEWIKVGYYAGFGEKNSEGMGCVEINN
jgi:CRISPR-associated endoribonuclease Cas6